jgi:hypothetical protein
MVQSILLVPASRNINARDGEVTDILAARFQAVAEKPRPA